jgi:sugar-phosphatase
MTFSCRALLFDLDGTVVSSLPAVDRAWSLWAESRGLVPAEILHKIHGRRSLDSLRELVPHLDTEAENLRLRELECSILEGVTEMPGAGSFLRSLPIDRFAYVTSGTQDVATARLRYVNFPIPTIAVYGDDVANGKPAPDPFALAAHRLGVDPADCIAFEDTAAGFASASAAGCQVVMFGELQPEGALANLTTWDGTSFDGETLTLP